MPTTESSSGFTPDELKRYDRQIILPQIGVEGQRRLRDARVLLVGAGGLGSPLALYLAAAGVGTLGIIDPDVVDASNLHRQLLHGAPSIGRPKVDSASERLAEVNPSISIVPYRARLSSENAMEILRGYHVVADGSDNFPTRYLVNDACVMLGIPNAFGSVFKFEGQATTFWPGRGPCYRCLYPAPPPPGAVPSCAEAGVLGILPGSIGLAQATEVIKIILGLGEPLVGRLMLYDALAMQYRELKFERDPACPVCGDAPTIHELIDYEAFCGLDSPESPASRQTPDSITVGDLKAMLDAGADIDLIDCREPHEREISSLGGELIPMRAFGGRAGSLDPSREIIVYCRSGARSGAVVRFLRDNGFARARNLVGGINEWARVIDPDMQTY